MASRPYPARRCSECHETTNQTWLGSTHARADTSPLYRAMRDASGRDDCDRCHAPLRALVPDDPALAAEGITCDVCHTLRHVEVDRHRSVFDFDLTSAKRYGSLCYAEDHYFHKMGCLPLYTRSELCGGCHLWTTHTTAGVELDMLTTYADWRAGPYAEAGQSCQGCHMAAKAGEVAVGWGTRATASDHGMFGPDDELRRRALSLELDVHPEGTRLRVDLDVTNAGAGHPLPAGLPARRIVLDVIATGGDGQPIAQEQRIYARILVDAQGAEVPFYAAHHQRSDTRLQPQQSRRERLWLPRAGVEQVRVEVSDHPVSATIARQLGVAPPPPIPLASARATRRGPERWEREEQRTP